MPEAGSLSADLSEYLRRLPAERRTMLRRLRSRIRQSLPKGYVERFSKGMLTYQIPLTMYPNTYNGQPLWVAALASQRSYVTLYLMAVYGDKSFEKWFRAAYAASGRTLRMGKSCVHFRSLDEIPFGLVGETIAKVPIRKFIEIYERARLRTRSGK